MSLWGSSNTGSQQEPKFLANSATPYSSMFQRYGTVYANKSGWWITHPSKGSTAKGELLVAIKGLSDKLGAPIINDLWFSGTDNTGKANVLSANTQAKINIAYTQQVVIKSGTAPTFNLAATGATSGNVVATYAQGNSNNILQFTFTSTSDFGGLANANTYYVVNDQPISVAAGIIVGVANTSMNANTLIPTSANTKFPFTSRTPAIRAWDPTAVITGINFASATVARNAASNVFVTFSKAVNVLTAALPNVSLTVAAGNTTNATYASGNGTANLRFTWTAPQFVANVVTATAASTLLVGFINSVSANGAANTYITAAVATAAGNVTPT